jgi:hypothetical protein
MHVARRDRSSVEADRAGLTRSAGVPAVDRAGRSIEAGPRLQDDARLGVHHVDAVDVAIGLVEGAAAPERLLLGRQVLAERDSLHRERGPAAIAEDPDVVSRIAIDQRHRAPQSHGALVALRRRVVADRAEEAAVHPEVDRGAPAGDERRGAGRDRRVERHTGPAVSVEDREAAQRGIDPRRGAAQDARECKRRLVDGLVGQHVRFVLRIDDQRPGHPLEVDGARAAALDRRVDVAVVIRVDHPQRLAVGAERHRIG